MQLQFSLGLLVICLTELYVFAYNRHHWTVLHAKIDRTICDPDIPSRPSHLATGTIDPDDGQPHIVCQEGEYLDWYKCSPCDEGTFMTRQMVKTNRLSRCQKCQEPGMYEILTEPCNRTRDSRIMCEDGLYRYEVPGKPCLSACFRCDVCGIRNNMFKEFEGSACGGYNNTVCCPDDDMIAVDGRCTPAERKTATTSKATTNVGPETELATWSLQDLEHEWEYPEVVERAEFVYVDTEQFKRNFGLGLKTDFKNLVFIAMYNYFLTVALF